MRQRTIAEKISCTGIGLHSGAPVQLTLHPARLDTGIVFVRSDAGRGAEIPARIDRVGSTQLATTLGHNGSGVGTVEHLLAALYGLGIDNVRIELDGPEVPVMDGSAAPFVFLIRAAGIFEQRGARRVLRVRRPVEVRDGERMARIDPCRGFRISYHIDFRHPAIGRQDLPDFELSEGSFERELSRARTFGFLHEVEALWRAGLGRGGSLDNTIVLDERQVLNPEGLRMADEFVRHKALDLLGDLALLGLPLEGRVRVVRGGHALHQRLMRALLDTPGATEIVTSGRGTPHPEGSLAEARASL
ncbi:MAG: UDP-3-O-acyl-N-acetylglucosamine deacetylase [Deltaproteobacteria bacterium]|nr:UDP-3-O-acyl-N-acetylglucosamine deacetylase [Deltaproteobacteria bacterium]